MSEFEIYNKKALGYKKNLLEKLNEQRKIEPGICDIKIIVDNSVFYVHKCIMIASSDYFAAMFRSDMQESRQDKIELKGITSKGLSLVLDFIYTGVLNLSASNIENVLRTVSHLQIKHAFHLCQDFLLDILNDSNCITILNLVDLFSLKDIKSKIDLYILRNVQKLIKNNSFKKLTFEQLTFFLESNQLRLYPEIEVFKACLDWLDFNPNYKQNLSNIIKHVRFNTMKPDEFINIVTKNDLIKSNPETNKYLIEAYEYFSLPSRQYVCNSARSRIRNEPVMVCVNDSMYILNQREESWQYLCKSNATSKILSQKFVVVNNFLYACGGYSEKDRETCDKCYRFDPRTGKWQSIASMNEKRQFFTLATNNEYIIAVGGMYGSIGNFYATFPISSPLEYYSIEKDTWTSAKLENSSLPILKWPGACVFGDKNVFIVGGKLTQVKSLCQQSFIVDLNTNKVDLCEPPLTARFNPSVFYSNNRIILFGGEDEKFRLAPCIEMFDLNTRQWSEIATIPISFSYQCISSTNIIESKINYVIEELDGPLSESYVLESASFDINTRKFDLPVRLPIPSTHASKWCYLTFPMHFLEIYHNLSSDDSND